MKKNTHLGSSFEDFLKEENLFDEAEAIAIKRVIAQHIEEEMRMKDLNKVSLAKKMATSRSSLDRLLDPANTSVSLKTLLKATHVFGKKLVVAFA